MALTIAKVTVDGGPAVDIALSEHTYKTGTVGFKGSLKTFDSKGAKYQVNIDAYKVGSKPAK